LLDDLIERRPEGERLVSRGAGGLGRRHLGVDHGHKLRPMREERTQRDEPTVVQVVATLPVAAIEHRGADFDDLARRHAGRGVETSGHRHRAGHGVRRLHPRCH
jgi:hypothetical protein